MTSILLLQYIRWGNSVLEIRLKNLEKLIDPEPLASPSLIDTNISLMTPTIYFLVG
jgi:hypothetical protein